MQHSSSDNIQKVNVHTAMMNKRQKKMNAYGAYYSYEDSRKHWNKPDNSKCKTLRTHRTGK